jgi:ATP-dependent Lon protease
MTATSQPTLDTLPTAPSRPIARHHQKVPPEVVRVVQQIDDYGRIADTLASHLAVKIADKQGILETNSGKSRFCIRMTAF